MSDPPPDPPRRAVDAYVADLAAAAPAETRRFTLERGRARELLRQFQLSDPALYAVLLVQTAVLRRATHIDCLVDAAHVHLAFHGTPFDRSDLDGLYDGVMEGDVDVAAVARRRLALALNAHRTAAP